MQKRLYIAFILVHEAYAEAYADATLNALSEMLHLHRIIIYFKCTGLKEDVLLTRKSKTDSLYNIKDIMEYLKCIKSK